MKQKILFLEDELTIAEVTSEYMITQGYSVTHVTDGQLALDAIAAEQFDLIILDIMVPKITGLAVLAKITKNHNTSPVIILSALGDQTTQLQAFDFKADDYIIKPFSPLLLLKRIEALLRRAQMGANLNDLPPAFVLDEKTYAAYYNQKSLELTLTEYLIVQKLYQNQNQVFTRDQLLSHLFSADYYPNDRVIDAHIKNIRKKLPENYIKTIMGVGYQFKLGNINDENFKES
ncbi:MAG: response regulator transcription factor [Culicoidibacterales bacterium]